MNDKMLVYKILLSIGLGLISFFISLHPIGYYLSGQVTSINPGLWIPLLISMVWGWKFGLLACTVGLGTQYGWFVWYRSGWGALLGVASHTLWVVFHGWWYELCKRKNNWLNPYWGEVGIRIFLIISYYYLFPLMFQFNPPFFAPEITNTILEIKFVTAVVIKQTVEGILWLSVCDTIINSHVPRKIFKLPLKKHQAYTSNIVTNSVVLGIFIVFLVACKDFFIGGQGSSLLENFLFNKDATAVQYRLIIVALSFAFGIIYSKRIKKIETLNISLQKSNRKLDGLFESVPVPLAVIDKNFNVAKVSNKLQEVFQISDAAVLDLRLGHPTKCFDIFKLDICKTKKCPVQVVSSGKSKFETLITPYSRTGKGVVKQCTGELKSEIRFVDTEDFELIVDFTPKYFISKTDQRLNCWEYNNCKKDCDAKHLTSLNGVHHGKNGGRCCWAIEDKKWTDQTQTSGRFDKLNKCSTCDFAKLVNQEETKEATIFDILKILRSASDRKEQTIKSKKGN